jgi:anaerobic C4-dicarboxylate transporter DcuA
VAGDLLHNYPWLLAVVLFFAATLLFPGRDHQGADARRADAGREPADRHRLVCRRLRPVRSADLPTLLAAVEMDDTGSTRIGKYVFNHAFLIPGVIAITLCVILGFIFGGIML